MYEGPSYVPKGEMGRGNGGGVVDRGNVNGRERIVGRGTEGGNEVRTLLDEVRELQDTLNKTLSGLEGRLGALEQADAAAGALKRAELEASINFFTNGGQQKSPAGGTPHTATGAEIRRAAQRGGKRPSLLRRLSRTRPA